MASGSWMPAGADVWVRGLLGAALIAQPARAVTSVGQVSAPAPRAIMLTRVLGLRHLAEAALLRTKGDPDVRTMLAGVDVIHGLSMVALALVARRYRRLGAAAALVAGALAVLEVTSRESHHDN